MKNTYTSGNVRTLIFQEKKVWYGVALEFNIVESASNMDTVIQYLNSAIRAYVHVAQEVGATLHVLNQTVDVEYEKMWNSVHARGRKSQPSPCKIYKAESLSLATL